MPFQLSPAWWPLLALASPVIAPWLVVKKRRFDENYVYAVERNRLRMDVAEPLDMPELDAVELTVLVEYLAKDGFQNDAAVSYLFETDRGSLLFDVGYGPANPVFSHNAKKLGFHAKKADALAISHLHCDHMGGIPAQRARKVAFPKDLMPSSHIPCFLPDRAEAEGFNAEVIETPRMLAAGLASTGPLARSLFVMGYTEEQAIVGRIRNKGLMVFTGCGHPTIEVILDMVRRLSDEPVYAIGGGLHFPVTGGRGNRAGIQFQTFLGTGKPPWKRITLEDLGRAIDAINEAGPAKVFLSAHDTCDFSLKRMQQEIDAEVCVLEAGSTYSI